MHAWAKAADGRAFLAWLVSKQGQAAIADFRVDGHMLFHPNAKPANAP